MGMSHAVSPVTPAEVTSARAIGYRLRRESPVLHLDPADVRTVVEAVLRMRAEHTR